MKTNKFLFLIWKDPITRRNFIVGKLCKNDKFTFEYCNEYEKAEKYGWSKLEAFPEIRTYESETIFPVFASRLPDRKRKDIDKILDKYGLSMFDEFELLRKSEARLPIDTYSFIDPIFPEDETVSLEFFVMGIRYNTPCKGEECSLLPNIEVGDELIFEKEPNNKEDSNAICIKTMDGSILGYVPRYYNSAVIERLDKGMSYSCKVLEIRRDQECSECVKVKLNIPKE